MLAEEPDETAVVSIPFDRIADDYDRSRGGDQRAERIAGDLLAFLDPAQVALDVGIGTGIVTARLADLGQPAVGVDLSPAMARRARDRLGARVAVADAAALPVADGSVGQALSVWVLHLVADVGEVLREVRRALRPGGRYLVVPGGFQRDPIDEVLRPLARALGSRHHLVAPQALEPVAAAAGLRVADVREGAAQEFEQAPSEVVAAVRQRSFSYLWDVDEDRWQQLVIPAIDALQALPDPDRPRRRRNVQSVIVLESAGRRAATGRAVGR